MASQHAGRRATAKWVRDPIRGTPPGGQNRTGALTALAAIADSGAPLGVQLLLLGLSALTGAALVLRGADGLLG
jgi:hypothetical protein